MNRSNRISIRERRGWLQDLNSMLVSALCHLATFIALGLLSVVSSDGWQGVKLSAHLGNGLDAIAIDESTLDEVKLEVTATDSAAAMDPLRLFDVTTIATADIAALEALSENSAVASGLEGLALAGSGDDDSELGSGSAEFFGIGGYGQSFVYVVDCSGSMGENRKFERAVYELLQSIEQLHSDQRYFVIFYSSAAYPMDADEPVLATEDQFARTRRWIDHIRPDGGTHPLPALLLALSLRPDAIYFLSDGQFDPGAIHALRHRNRPNKRLATRQIPIHTIAFVDRATEGLMRTIARNSGGKFRFVK
jgi:hypothetical protein